MRNVVGENCIKYKKTNPAIGPTQLGTCYRSNVLGTHNKTGIEQLITDSVVNQTS